MAEWACRLQELAVAAGTAASAVSSIEHAVIQTSRLHSCHVPFLDRFLNQAGDFVVHFGEIGPRFYRIKSRITLAFFVKHDGRWKWIRAPRVGWRNRSRHLWFVVLLLNESGIDRQDVCGLVFRSVAAIFAEYFQRHVAAIRPPVHDENSRVRLAPDLLRKRAQNCRLPTAVAV